MPLPASESRFGVLISPPNEPMSANPRSSPRMTTMFGRRGASAAETMAGAARLTTSAASTQEILVFISPSFRNHALLEFPHHTSRTVKPDAGAAVRWCGGAVNIALGMNGDKDRSKAPAGVSDGGARQLDYRTSIVTFGMRPLNFDAASAPIDST